jgi:hypothetical protein
LIRRTTEEDMLFWTAWRYRSTDEDRDWDWWSIYRECVALPERYECYPADARGDLQGLMTLDLTMPRSKPGAITIDYLATNPANRAADAGLKHVGIALIGVAVMRSRKLAAKGGIRLEALPGAAKFYENLGMERQPLRSADGNAVFVLSESTAEEFLEEISSAGILEL